jgi:hypothetical protein
MMQRVFPTFSKAHALLPHWDADTDLYRSMVQPIRIKALKRHQVIRRRDIDTHTLCLPHRDVDAYFRLRHKG